MTSPFVQRDYRDAILAKDISKAVWYLDRARNHKKEKAP